MPHVCIVANASKARNPSRVDPTRTGLIRGRFVAELVTRFRRLKEAVIDFLVTQDALALEPANSFTTVRKLLGLAAPQRRQYAFQTDIQKLDTFNEYFRQKVEEEILRSVPGTFLPPQGSLASGPWMTRFIELAYKRGMAAAVASAQASGQPVKGIFGQQLSFEEFVQQTFDPLKSSKVQMLATRSFESLKGVTGDMAGRMNRILAQGMMDGTSVRKIAKQMTEEIDGLTRSRAMTIARTEIIHAHAEGQLDSFEELGIEELNMKVEWTTAGDDHVCPLCAKQAGKTFTIAKARGLIPLHPNCRCAWTAVEVKKKGKKSV